MILRELRAEGFMRYELLELGALPRGVIGLVGENESGKTTIGEAVAFALFGRTIRTEGTDPTQAIHWEKDECRTTVEVELPGKGVHRVERLVARTGEFEAKLTGPDGVIAEGPRKVADALTRLLGLDFSTFRYSFYVAQHELDLIQREGRDNARRIVYDMLGITTVERARSQLERERAEALERASTLEKDLLVAQALHDEALPARHEGQRQQELLEAARFRQAEAATEEQRARIRREQALQAVDAGRERADAVQRVEASVVAAAQRQLLLQSLRRLEALQGRAQAEVERGEGAAQAADAPRMQAREALAQAQGIERAAQSLASMVTARRDQLAREIAPETGPDSLPARLAREAEVAARERKTGAVRMGMFVAFLLVALACGGWALATRYPAEKPLIAFEPTALAFPSVGVTWELTAQNLTPPLVALASTFLVAGVVMLVLRNGAARRAANAAAEIERLKLLDVQEHKELDACRAFTLGPLGDIAGALEPVTAENVRAALTALATAAGAHMDGRATPAELAQQAQARIASAEVATRETDAGLADARRTLSFTKNALEQVRGTIGVAFPEGVPQAAPPATGDAPKDLAGLEAEAQRVLGVAVRARIELEGIEAGRRAAPVGEAVQALKAAIAKGLDALGDEARVVRSRYDDQSGLSELLRARPETPDVDDLRAVVRRERELLDELFGDEATLRAGLLQAESAARRAREELLQAQGELDAARVAAERLRATLERLDALETRVHELSTVLSPARRDLAVQGEAIALLDELTSALKARFGPAICRYVEMVMPRLTNGRYRRARIDEDLDIRIFSPERGDFVRLIELSFGTADQVLLALRLGLARALVASRGLAGGHFLFLDEPLVSADPERERAFLELLRTFDDEFAQIFVTSPRAMEEGPFVRTLELTRDAHVQRLGSVAGTGVAS